MSKIESELAKLKKLSDLIADFEKTAEETQRELSEIKATMVANFDGSQKHLPKLLQGTEKTATQMFIPIIEYYVKKVAEQAEKASVWFLSSDQLPSEDDCYEVIGFNKQWINEDFNPNGTRICGYFANNWVIGRWDANNDEWITDWTGDDDCPSEPPTHWMRLPVSPRVDIPN